MGISPEWVAVILTAFGMSAGAGAYLQRRITERRAVTPLIRTRWSAGPKGRSVNITVVNRLNEDLAFSRARAKAAFVVKVREEGPPDDPVITERSVGQSIQLDWIVEAGKEASFWLKLSGTNCPRWIALTVSSSAKTLRCKRLIINDSQEP